VTLLTALTEAPAWGWLSAAFGCALLASAALFAAWWVAERPPAS
jgi:hypothetical protein